MIDTPQPDTEPGRHAGAAPAPSDPCDRPILDAGSPCPACGRGMVRQWCRVRCETCGFFEGCED